MSQPPVLPPPPAVTIPATTLTRPPSRSLSSKAIDFARSLSKEELKEALLSDRFTQQEALQILYDWSFWARPEQLPPPGDWRVWLIKPGRGWGKSKTGAQWTVQEAQDGCGPIALVGQTVADVRDVMIKGPAGILACSPPWFMPVYETTKRLLTWPNGVTAHTYSGDNPDQLRGPQFRRAWLDELMKFRYAQQCWDHLDITMRHGIDQKVLITSTPRPLPLLMEIMGDPETFTQDGSIYDNRGNLPPAYLRRMERRFSGTRWGLQELEGKILTDTPGALWNRPLIDRYRLTNPRDLPTLRQIVVAVDPSMREIEEESSQEDQEGSECGIVVVGLGATDNRGYVLEDASGYMSDVSWGQRVCELYAQFRANYVVAERNNGGTLVRTNIRVFNDTIPVTLVWASHGKEPRAQPVASLYEQGRVSHVGTHVDLEGQMCNYNPRAKDRHRQLTDRMDALVWGFFYLMLGDERMPHYNPVKHRVQRWRRPLAA